MRRKDRYCPHWTWWIRAGQRLELGLDVRLVLRAAGLGLPSAVEAGLGRSLQSVGDGAGIVASLRGSGMVLPAEAWSLLDAGEQAGTLAEAMGRTGELLRERDSRRKTLAGQLWYPGMVALTGLLVMGLILFWVIPQMRGVSASMGYGEDLPWLTENIGTLYGSVLLGTLSAVAVAAGAMLALGTMGRRHQRWADAAEALYRHLPAFGQLRHSFREARLSRQLGILLRAGITLPHALQMAAADAPDRWEQLQLKTFRDRLLMGSGFPEAVAACPLVSREYLPLLESGQESGRLDVFLLQVADDRDRIIHQQIASWIRFLEPAMLLLLSMAIGGLILAYLLPMVTMLERLA